MSETPKHLSVSFRVDNGCVEHNNRNFFSDNVDKNRTPDNITYVRRDLRELYHELFDEALAEYNSRQTRSDRKIPDYYEHIRLGKKEKLFQEIIVMFGNSENCGVGSENWETAKSLLDEYMRDFEKRNPNLKVFNAVVHLDEATPHLHINFVPVCYGQRQGLSTRVSMKRAIQQMGFSANGKRETEIILWGNSERNALTDVLNNHHIARKIVGVFHDHKTVEEYKRYADIDIVNIALHISLKNFEQQYNGINIHEAQQSGYLFHCVSRRLACLIRVISAALLCRRHSAYRRAYPTVIPIAHVVAPDHCFQLLCRVIRTFSAAAVKQLVLHSCNQPTNTFAAGVVMTSASGAVHALLYSILVQRGSV